MSKTYETKRDRLRHYRGATTTRATFLGLSLAAIPIIESNRTDIDKLLGTSSTELVTDEDEDDSSKYTYTSDYANTTELVQAIQATCEQMSGEGTVLLKNENDALPLSSDEMNVSLLGFSSYYPVQGGDMGSICSTNSGTDADTVDFVTALSDRGFSINTEVQEMYTALESNFSTDVENWGTVTTYTHITAPTTDGYFTSKEPSQDTLASTDSGWISSLADYNTILVTLARSSGENRSYLPGTAGVDSSQSLNQADPLGLSDDERDLIAAAIDAKNSNGGKVIVILNNACPMEVDEIQNDEGVDAILQIGLPGAYGFYAVADILAGTINPSGHLADTYAVDNSSSPSAQNYGDFEWTNADSSITMNSEIVEAENIYIGYKYYETRYMDCVLGQGNADDATGSSTGSSWSYADEVTYPFGYGLSYTTFEQTLDSVDVDLTGSVTANVTVTNTGEVAGKDVVQLYVSLPYTEYDQTNGVEKAGVQLLDYAKTSELEAGASETVTITANPLYMASWDSTASNLADTTGCYILDDGDYYFTIGNGAHEAANNVLAYMGCTTDDGMTAEGDSTKVQVWTLDTFDSDSFALSSTGTAVENQLADMDLNYWIADSVTYLSRSDWAGTFPITYEGLTATDEMLEYLDNDIYEISADNGDTSEVTFGADNGLTLADLKGNTDIDDEAWSNLMDQITLEECMIRLAFGGTSCKSIDSISSPEAVQNDGPNGFNSYSLGQYAETDSSTGDPCAISEDDTNYNYTCGVMCSATITAATFNKDLVYEWGQKLGNYSLWGNLPILWGAGTNIHRCVYNARNHEYYSEDPVLSSYQGAAMIEGGKEYGLIIAPKHFAFNDIEINRTGISVFMTEQQARENELRATQACVEDAGCLGIMTAFNRAGIVADNAHTGLLSNILHGEWGFQGLMSEDYIMDANYACLKEAAMNGVTMTSMTGDSTMSAVTAYYDYWVYDDVATDAQLMAALKQCMLYQNYALANSNAMDGLSSSSHYVDVRTWYDNVLLAVQILFGVWTAAGVYGYAKAALSKEEDYPMDTSKKKSDDTTEKKA